MSFRRNIYIKYKLPQYLKAKHENNSSLNCHDDIQDFKINF